MDLSFYPLTLEAIDQAAAESLCLFIAADERPLTGLAGLADWRLSGRLSRLLRGGLLTGEAGEAVLTPPGPRMSFQKLFLFGVGAKGQSEEELAARVAEALRKLAQAGVREAALQLPARLPMEAGMRTLVDELQGPGRALVFAPDPQKLVTALSQAAARTSQPPPERVVVKVPAAPVPAPVKPVLPAVKSQPRPQALPAQPPAAPALPVAQSIPVALPKASPLPFAPQGPPQLFPQAAPPSLPKATPLPFAPVAQPSAAALLPPAALPAAKPLATGPAPQTAVAPVAAQASDAAGKPSEERKPAPPPPQRYVPPPPKPHVFEKSKRKKR